MRAWIVAAALLLSTGCYHYRIAFPTRAPQGLEPRRETKWSFLWGAVQQNIEDPPSCPSNSLAAVTTTTNYLYGLITVLSLGLAAPIDIEWRCAVSPSPDL